MTLNKNASRVLHTSPSSSSSTAASFSMLDIERLISCFRQFRSASFRGLTVLAALNQVSEKSLVVGSETYLMTAPFFFSLAMSLTSFVIASFIFFSWVDPKEADCDALGAMTQLFCLVWRSRLERLTRRLLALLFYTVDRLQ